jgi:hypothetical protein
VSAPGDVVMREYGFTVANVCKRTLALLRYAGIGMRTYQRRTVMIGGPKEAVDHLDPKPRELHLAAQNPAE